MRAVQGLLQCSGRASIPIGARGRDELQSAPATTASADSNRRRHAPARLGPGPRGDRRLGAARAVVRDLVDTQRGARGDRRCESHSLRCAGRVRARPLAVLPRCLARSPGAPPAPGRIAGRDQGGAHGPLRRLGHGAGRHASRGRGVPRRPPADRRALPRPLRGLEKLGQHRGAWHLRSGRRRAGDVRRADRAAARSGAARCPVFLARRRARRTRRSRLRDRRSLRRHRLVAAPAPGQSVARGARLLDPGPAAPPGGRSQRLSAGVPGELPDDARAAGGGAPHRAATDRPRGPLVGRRMPAAGHARRHRKRLRL